jgi:manganese efflux pump family protein
MAVIAFITWLITAAAGLGLVSIWIIERGEATAPSRLPRTVVGAHGLLAFAGLAAWGMYLVMDTSTSGGIAIAILVVVYLLGATMGVRYIRVYRAYKARSPALVRVGSGGIGVEEPTPPERHLPLGLVITHGVMATVTIALVVLTALDLSGS